MYSQLIEKLKIRLQSELPGTDAQFKMAPKIRFPLDQFTIQQNNPRPSSILILLYPVEENLHTVLIHRNEYEGMHSNQVSFPGGKKDHTDNNAEETALRETKEELGIDISKVEVLGKLTDFYIQPSNFIVCPYVGFMENRPDFNPDPGEVQSLIEVSLNTLLDDNTVKTKMIRLANNMELETPYYDADGQVVWGATAMMMSEFITVLKECWSDQ
jgi:8-oxo-dGTP pyrophosphatase MutT (NUDIX family)